MFHWRKTQKFVSFLVCLSGLIFQVNEVSNSYFKFATESKVLISAHQNIQVPSISVCFRKYDIVDYRKLEKAKGKTVKRYTSHVDATKLWNEMTISDYFHFTPKEQEVITL